MKMLVLIKNINKSIQKIIVIKRQKIKIIKIKKKKEKGKGIGKKIENEVETNLTKIKKIEKEADQKVKKVKNIKKNIHLLIPLQRLDHRHLLRHRLYILDHIPNLKKYFFISNIYL